MAGGSARRIRFRRAYSILHSQAAAAAAAEAVVSAAAAVFAEVAGLAEQNLRARSRVVEGEYCFHRSHRAIPSYSAGPFDSKGSYLEVQVAVGVEEEETGPADGGSPENWGAY